MTKPAGRGEGRERKGRVLNSVLVQKEDKGFFSEAKMKRNMKMSVTYSRNQDFPKGGSLGKILLGFHSRSKIRGWLQDLRDKWVAT